MIPFLRGQDVSHGSSECMRALNLIVSLIKAPLIEEKNWFKGYISTKGISVISTINALE